MPAASKPIGIVLLLFLLLPSAVFLARFSDLPRFGEVHDDALYFVGAKGLADGHGYVIESLPGEPAQTKYPPLYPLLLSVAWRVNSTFPDNLAIAGWLTWLALPVIVLQLAWVFPKLGFSKGRTWALLALFTLNPYVMLFSTQLLTELWYLALVLAAMQLVERGAGPPVAVQWVLAAGVVAGLAYLTRSAGLALFAAAPLYLWLRRERKAALWFVAAVVPFFLGWTLWARTHQTATDDPELLYYLDYFRYQFYAVPLRDLPVVLWKNVDGILWGLGGLVLPKVASSLFLKILSEVIAVAMISGVVRMFRRGQARLYAWFALFSTLMLVVWHFPPNERFMLPVFPLALGGLLVEAEHVAAMLRSGLRHPDRSQRVVAGAMVGLTMLVVVGSLTLQAYVAAVFLPEDARDHRARRAARQPEYAWVRANLPMDEQVLSLDDVLLYLNTGRKAMRRPVPPFLWYREDHDGMVAWLSDVSGYAEAHHLDAFEFAGADATLGLEEEDREKVAKDVEGNPALTPLFAEGPVTIYQVAQP